MLRGRIRKDIEKAVSELVGKWAIGSEVQARRDGEVEVSRPGNSEHGDYSTNVALKVVTRDTKQGTRSEQSSVEFARKLADSLKNQPYIEKLEVKDPGFINFFVKDEIWQKQVSDVLKSASGYGSNQTGKGKKARVEFVSANPTGPLHFGNARGGPIGDTLASVLEFSGYRVLREYYHNDVGVQVEKLGQSIINVERGQKLEDQEYKGEYVRDLLDQISKNSKLETRNSKQAGEKAVEILLKDVLKDCENMGIKFDKVQAESELISSGKTKSAIDFLQKKKALRKKDGAIWFVPRVDSGQAAKFLEDRESVVIKSDGDFTYFANDIAYHRFKFEDKPDLVIDIFGANHHGHVPRLKAVIQSLGYDTDKFRVILYQWVRFKRGSEVVKMSKRSGTFVTVREVLDEVGRDALRFFILMHDANTHIDFDLSLAREKSAANPVYYVQYAHARIASILRKANWKLETGNWKPSHELLTNNYELNLLKQISRFPEFVEDIAESFAVNQLTTYAVELADSFHKFYENVQVLTEKKELRDARLALISATQITLANTLKLLGVTAPEKM